MCLAVPARIVELEGTTALADLHGNRLSISTMLTPGVGPGDWVLVHAGFAIQQLDAAAAAETFSLMNDLQEAMAASAAEAAAPLPIKGGSSHA
jgi:hydrogenase expression/formation protein HypC